MARKSCVLTVLAVWIWQTPTPSVRAQEFDETRAIKVRASYLYNFAKFTEWPDDAFEDEASPFVVGVLGDGPFGQILSDTVKSKRIGRRSITIKRLQWSKPGDRRALAGCHVLYVTDSEEALLKEFLAVLKEKPILLVSGIRGFASDGGMIGFMLENERIIFEINRESLKQAHLKVSAKLLKLARIVKLKVRHPREPNTGGGTSEMRRIGE